jgi:hypothetical protein
MLANEAKMPDGTLRPVLASDRKGVGGEFERIESLKAMLSR